jgi:zinc finger protein
LSIPEIELVLQAGTLGGRFTTLEGILDQVYEELSDKVFAGDSSNSDNKGAFETFLTKLKEVWHPYFLTLLVSFLILIVVFLYRSKMQNGALH